jgi:hypothetical protein
MLATLSLGSLAAEHWLAEGVMQAETEERVNPHAH